MKECINKWCMLNGKLVVSEEVKDTEINSSIYVYEVMRVVQGKLLFIEEHLERFHQSVTKGKILYLTDLMYINECIQTYLFTININEGNIKLLLEYNILNQLNNLYVYQIKHNYPTVSDYRYGVEVALLKADRENPMAKIVQQGLRNQADQLINEKGVYEALLVNKHGQITEGSRSNIFFIMGEEIITAPDYVVLSGITLKKITNICNNLNFNLIHDFISINNLNKIDALFLTGTSPKVLPIKKIEQILYDVNQIKLRKIMEEFELCVKQYLNC